PPKNFNQIPALPTKHEHVTGKRILRKRRLHHPAQARETTPQIRHSCHNPDPRPCRHPDHPSKHSSAVRKTTRSTLPAIRRVPLGSSIRRIPAGPWQDLLRGFAALTTISLETLTGSRL